MTYETSRKISRACLGAWIGFLAGEISGQCCYAWIYPARFDWLHWSPLIWWGLCAFIVAPSFRRSAEMDKQIRLLEYSNDKLKEAQALLEQHQWIAAESAIEQSEAAYAKARIHDA